VRRAFRDFDFVVGVWCSVFGVWYGLCSAELFSPTTKPKLTHHEQKPLGREDSNPVEGEFARSWQINPLPVQFKSLLPGQEGCVFFSGHLNICTCHYALVRLDRQAAFKSSTLECVRTGKGLSRNSGENSVLR
jgi:hypothetical protein